MMKLPFFRRRKNNEIVAVPDEELYRLINLNFWDPEQRELFDNDAVLKRVLECPESVCVKYEFKASGRGFDKNYPLKKVIALGADIKLVKTMYKIFPQAVEEGDPPFRITPLHTASAMGASFEVIQFLLRKFPDAAKLTTKHGYTALHNACEYPGLSPESVELLVHAFPEALTMRNKLGKTPFQTAILKRSMDPKVLEVLRQFHKEDESDTTPASSTFFSTTLE